MTDVPFHLTVMGRRFYEHTLPALVAELARINASLAELAEEIAKVRAKDKEEP
jgi:hypothetical protein